MLRIHQVHPDDSRARKLLRAYIEDVASSYHRRQLSVTEIDAAVAEFPNDDLVPPHGALLIAVLGDTPVGCVGLRILAHGLGEVTRLYVAPAHRRCGLGNRLMAGLEQRAGDDGLTLLRLDTRHDLIEARGLYARRGFREVKPFNAGPYAEHWLEKPLA